jgi:hypothetical protein
MQGRPPVKPLRRTGSVGRSRADGIPSTPTPIQRKPRAASRKGFGSLRNSAIQWELAGVECGSAFWPSGAKIWTKAEQLANQALEECTAAGALHPVGHAMGILAGIAHRRRQSDAALEFLRDAAALYRELGDPWQLADILNDLAAQEAYQGRDMDALQTLAESSEIDRQIGRLRRRATKLAATAVVHLARGERALATSALGAYDAHPGEGPPRPLNRVGGYIGWLVDAVEATRARLDPTEVASAAAAARSKSLDELIDELVIQPANATRAPGPSTGPPDDR